MTMDSVSKFQNPFPPLELSIEDEVQLEDVAHLCVRNTIIQYQKYQYQDRRFVDRDVWKFKKRKENLRVYTERREKEIAQRRGSGNTVDHHRDYGSTTTESTCPSTSSRSTGSGFSAAPATPHYRRPHQFTSKVQSPPLLEMPVVLAVGTIEGTLEDAMYGAVNPTVDSMRIKTSYVDDNFAGGAVLSTLIAPTPQDPFRTLSIKWLEIAQPLHMGKFIRNRDTVILESTGITELPNGERVGYVLWHTVHLPQTHPLPSVTRSNMSICGLFRQHNATSVDVFLKGYLNPSTGIARALLVKSSVEAVVSVWKYVHCGRMKKLAWALQQQNECPIEHIHDDDNGKAPSRSGGSSILLRQICVNCKKRAKRHRFRSNKRATCKLCFQYVCSSCRIKKSVSYVATDGKLQENELSLCALCVHEAMIETDAMAVVSAEIAFTMQHREATKTLMTVSSMAMSEVSLFDQAASAW